MIGKRLTFGIISIVCITIMACKLTLSGEVIVKLVTIVCSLYIAGQTVTDFKNGGKNG